MVSTSYGGVVVVECCYGNDAVLYSTMVDSLACPAAAVLVACVSVVSSVLVRMLTQVAFMVSAGAALLVHQA